jgi:hypothetical protein
MHHHGTAGTPSTRLRLPRWKRALVIAATATLASLAIAGGTPGVASANSSFPEFKAVDAVGGVYWRNSANWNDSARQTGWGFYQGDDMQLQCYRWGTATPYSGNHLWYWSYDLSRSQAGWVNDHFLNTPGTAANPQPVTLPCE